MRDGSSCPGLAQATNGQPALAIHGSHSVPVLRLAHESQEDAVGIDIERRARGLEQGVDLGLIPSYTQVDPLVDDLQRLAFPDVLPQTHSTGVGPPGDADRLQGQGKTQIVLRCGLAPDANASATLELMREARAPALLQAKANATEPVFGGHFLKMVPGIASVRNAP